MTGTDAGLLFLAAIVAGGMNSVAGGGSFVSFPALIYCGVPATFANATNTVALWPGSVASAASYRAEFAASKAELMRLSAASVAGGFAGAALLIRTPERTFLQVLPFLMLAATLLFAFGNRLTARYRIAMQARGKGHVNPVVAFGAQALIATYGGYFGGGIGILMLAMLSIMGMENIHKMNAYKTVLASLINGIACFTFVVAGVVRWPQAVVMIAGAVLGGYFGAHYAQKTPPKVVRSLVIAIGCAVTVIFLGKAYL